MTKDMHIFVPDHVIDILSCMRLMTASDFSPWFPRLLLALQHSVIV